MDPERCSSCNTDMELAQPFCQNCGWRRPARLENTPKRQSKLSIILISTCATLAVMLISCHLLLKNITSPERSMEPLRAALQSGDEALFLELIGTNGNEEQAATLFQALQDETDNMFVLGLADAVREVHQSGLHQIIRGEGEQPLLRLYLKNRFGLYPVVNFAVAPGFGEVETKYVANETARAVTTDEITKEPLSAEEAKKVVGDLLDTIYDVFIEHREQFNWSEYKDPEDFGVLRPLLLDHASIRFTDGFLKRNASLFYCDCDALVFPYTSLDVRFNLNDVAADRFIASSIEFGDGHISSSNTIYYTVVKEDGSWKMDDMEWVPPTKEPINVTADEVLLYMKRFDPNVEIKNEAEYKGSKLFIVSMSEGRIHQGVHADSAEIDFDLPFHLFSTGSDNPLTLPLTRDQAEIAVKQYLEINEDNPEMVAYDRDNDKGHYVIRVYQFVDAGTEYEHTTTLGWYGVDPQTGRVYDAMFGE